MSSATSSQCSSSLSPERVQSCASSSTSCIGDSNPPTSNQVRTGRNNSILVTSQLSRTDFVDYKQIYRGRYSGIFLCKFKNTGRDVVVKVYPKAIVPSKRIRAVKREAAICRKIKYSSSTSYLSGSVELLGEFEDSTAAYIVQEYCKGRDLLCQIKANGGRVKEEYASTRILQPILRTLTGLHSLGVIHRDIKPENILVSQFGEVKIGGFALALDRTITRPILRVGTLDCMAPEVVMSPSLEETSYSGVHNLIGYDEKVDVWAVGVLAYEVLVGRPPFSVSGDPVQTSTRILRGARAPFPEGLSAEAQDFISQALTLRPNERPSTMALLLHPWIAKQSDA
uniref:Serine threonine protein kinase n=1 Tax=Tetraselmis sp. GSL018 TaxID=582737 RepID=A0A061RBM0_9CHLO|eukprot:CAMPEP_0177585154 /NCGR_PEP_ID=MMETSP0419_2-20121207/4312_1 /TAXON_ID=582737 /ORGANISM="Tetraselmis sp., Strain GSL018" /LENGTH=339 /DNA_ID=CAMNT_0019074809 /DNA_START=164 /DNA_END=1183 /DNA_ORIENTATION=+